MTTPLITESPQDQTSQSNDTKKHVSSVASFGTRVLKDPNEVFEHNAWDNMEWDEEQEQEAKLAVENQLKNSTLTEEDKLNFNQQAATFWDDFYSKNTDKFFKDRHWLTVEFPDIFNTIRSNPDETTRIFEIGCGAGNTVFPILAESKPEDKVYVYAGDFSQVAVNVVKSNPNYHESKCKSFVYDVTNPIIPEDIVPGSIDICICIFVLSAVHPDKWEVVRENLWKLLKPGGLVIFRDYGRYDLAQLRFKQNRVLGENFYVRGDGTQVYFFTNEELENGIFKGFTVEQNAVDRRLIVNRAKKLKMYRVWIQGKFRKPLETNS